MKFPTIADMIQGGALDMYYVHAGLQSPGYVRRGWLVVADLYSNAQRETYFY